MRIDENTGIQRYGQGLKITALNAFSLTRSAKNLLDLPFNSYFVDHESRLVTGNEWVAQNHHFNSVTEMQGKNLADCVPDKQAAASIIANDQRIRENQVSEFLYENYTVSDCVVMSYLSLKMPVYDAHGRVVGVFGCAKLLDEGVHQAIDFLNHLSQVDLLSTHQHAVYTQAMQSSHGIFTPREMQILQLSRQSYTAKEISLMLKISYRTVESHLENAKLKVKASSKRELLERVFDAIK